MAQVQTTIAICAGIISMLTASGAFWLSYKVFTRQKSLDNENHFFKYKIDQYQVIIHEAADLLDAYQNCFIQAKEEIQKSRPDDKLLNQIADRIDAKTDKFRIILYKYAAFIPEEIVTRLDDYFNSFYDASEKFDVVDVTVPILDVLLDKMNSYEDELEAITNLMRKDIGVDAIDRRLKARTHQ